MRAEQVGECRCLYPGIGPESIDQSKQGDIRFRQRLIVHQRERDAAPGQSAEQSVEHALVEAGQTRSDRDCRAWIKARDGGRGYLWCRDQMRGEVPCADAAQFHPDGIGRRSTLDEPLGHGERRVRRIAAGFHDHGVGCKGAARRVARHRQTLASVVGEDRPGGGADIVQVCRRRQCADIGKCLQFATLDIERALVDGECGEHQHHRRGEGRQRGEISRAGKDERAQPARNEPEEAPHGQMPPARIVARLTI